MQYSLYLIMASVIIFQLFSEVAYEITQRKDLDGFAVFVGTKCPMPNVSRKIQ